MLTRKDIFNRINNIIDLAYLTYAYDLLGDDFMSDEQKRTLESLGYIVGKKTLIEVLYALIRNQPKEGYSKKLQDLIESWTIGGKMPVFTDTQQATIDNAKAAMNDALENSKSEIKKQVRQKIIDVNKQYKQEQSVKRYVSIPETEHKKKDFTTILLDNLPAIILLVHSNFLRTFTSSMTDLINDTVVDRITEETIFTGKDPSKTLVYKVVSNDGSLCEWCSKFYGIGKPILYTLQELQENGSNYGKPKSAWKPVIGATHPRCRCELHEISNKFVKEN